MKNKTTPLSTRLLRKRSIDDKGCWIWTGSTKSNGYGSVLVSVDFGVDYVHRASYREFIGEIPPGMFVVFKDKNRQNICIENLEVIDRVEHIRRNHIQNLPQELKEVVHIKKSITRKINQIEKNGTK